MTNGNLEFTLVFIYGALLLCHSTYSMHRGMFCFSQESDIPVFFSFLFYIVRFYDERKLQLRHKHV